MKTNFLKVSIYHSQVSKFDLNDVEAINILLGFTSIDSKKPGTCIYISKKKVILLLNYWTIENYTSVENWLFKSFNLPLNTCLSTHFSLKGFLSFDLLPKTDFKFVTFFMFHHFKIAPLVVRLCTFPFLMICRTIWKSFVSKTNPSETESLHDWLRLSLYANGPQPTQDLYFTSKI